MDINDLRKLLEKSADKVSILKDESELKKYNFSMAELIELINTFFNDKEKESILSYNVFNTDIINSKIIDTISDENIKLQVIHDSNISEWEKVQIIGKMSNKAKMKVLIDKKTYGIDFLGDDIIFSFDDSTKVKILSNPKISRDMLNLNNAQITKLAKELSNDTDKLNVLKMYNLGIYEKEIVKSLSENDNKIKCLLEKNFNQNYSIEILETLDEKTLISFFKQNKDFYKKNNIHPYNVIWRLNKEKQMNFVSSLEDMELTLNEKLEILAVLKPEVKQEIDTSNFPEKYKVALSMKTSQYIEDILERPIDYTDSANIILDLERNPEDYRNFDNLITSMPEGFSDEQRKKFIEICKVCPDLTVKNSYTVATGKEYVVAENWITSVIGKIDPQYTDLQKIAVIDNAIGKKISFSPDERTEVFNTSNCRNIWRIITSGYGVCNGISTTEKYIFDRIGIESEIVDSETHAFLKIKNIEMPLENGEIVKGNTLLDSTWNLGRNKFGGMPNCFCLSYEDMRKRDIDSKGNDHKSHENDKDLQDATLSLSEQNLRSLFTSIGVADKNGKFPIGDFVEKSKLVDKIYAKQQDENISKQLLLFSKLYPNFAKCQQETMEMLTLISFNNENMDFNKCVINRVYNKSDKEKKPVVYAYIESNDSEKKFYYADAKEKKFIELHPKEFTEQFECYEADLERANGVRPWKSDQKYKKRDNEALKLR